MPGIGWTQCARSPKWRASSPPGGRLGLVWNIRDEREEWVAQLSRTMHRHGEEDDGDLLRLWSRRSGHCSATTSECVDNLTPAALIDMVASRSHLITLPDSQRRAVLSDVRELLHTHPDLVGAEEIVLPYVTQCYRTDVAVRVAASGAWCSTRCHKIAP